MNRIATCDDINEIVLISKGVKNNFVDEKYINEVINSSNYLLVVNENENKKILGFILLQVTSYDMDVINIAVDIKYRRLHVATSLFDFVFSYRENNEIYLDVRESNIPAIKLYESLGFTTYRRRVKYYGDEDCLCMKKIVKEGEL